MILRIHSTDWLKKRIRGISMSIQYEHARKGYKYVPTPEGERDGRLNKKFKDNYESCVPKSWVTKGWVQEVKNGKMEKSRRSI